MPSWNIDDKAEDAVAAWISDQAGANLTGVTTYKGRAAGAITLPSIHVYVSGGEFEDEEGHPTGNVEAELVIELRTSMSDTNRAAHGGFAAALRDMFIRDDLATDLNGVAGSPANFTALDWYAVSFTNDAEERVRITTITGTLLCAPSDL